MNFQYGDGIGPTWVWLVAGVLVVVVIFVLAHLWSRKQQAAADAEVAQRKQLRLDAEALEVANEARFRLAEEDRQKAETARQEAEADRQRAEAEERFRVERRAQNHRQAEAMIRENASRAAARFSSLPNLITEVDEAHDSARRHFAEGAFSPFWSSVERAYTGLGQFYKTIRAISDAAQSHPKQIEAFTSEYGKDDSLPAFPVDLIAIKAMSVGETLAKGLEGTVYEAQKHAVFAQIWEQRRTTAAVIAGFHNMEQAVAGMSQVLSTEIRDLSHTASVNAPTLTNNGDPQMNEAVRMLTRLDLRAKGMTSLADMT